MEYADINGDGLPELIANVFATQEGPTRYFDLSILPNLGKGFFGAPINLLAPQGTSATLVGDFNGDGLPDLPVEGGRSSIIVGMDFLHLPSWNQGGSSVTYCGGQPPWCRDRP